MNKKEIPNYAVIPDMDPGSSPFIRKHNFYKNLDSVSTHAMTTKTKAFTLIELLVVVLIIGILAAIALPQYEKAVEKSKAAQAFAILNSAYQAAQSYYMANGDFPQTFEDMGFEIPWTGKAKWSTQDQIKDTKSNDEWSLQLYYTAGKDVMLLMGRISGKYDGAGLILPVANGNHELPTYGKKFYCGERKSKGDHIFSTDLPEGAYCEKVMGGTLNTGSIAVSYRPYNLP